MPWGALRESAMVVVLRLRGAQQYVRDMRRASAATGQMVGATKAQGIAAQNATKRTWLHNQALFTARRYAFYASLAMTALAFSVARMGFSYLSAMQEARAALSPVLTGTGELTNEMNRLWRLAAITPFQFKDVTQAFRIMFAAFHAVGISAAMTNTTIERMTDALSYAGKVTPQSLNRVSVALQHLAFLGRPTGQVMLQLARDGLPIYAALHKELGLTQDQMRNIVKTGVTARDVIGALNRYIAKTPGYMNAAIRMQERTIGGAWSTFKDLLSQAAGTSERGLFGGLFRMLKNVNKQMAVFYSGTNNQQLTLTKFVTILDSQLSPKTHIVIRLFVFMEYLLFTIFIYFGLLTKVVQKLLTPFDMLGNAIGKNNMAVKILAIWFGVMISLWVTGRIVWLAFILSLELGTVYLYAVTAATWAWDMALGAAIIALYAADTALFALLMTALPIVGILIVVAAMLVYMYFRFKPFRDIVNETWSLMQDAWTWFISQSPYVKVAILIAFGPLGWAVATLYTLIKAFQWLKSVISSIHLPHWMSSAWGWLSSPKRIFGAAGGGVMPYASPLLVGEHGAELMYPPQGTRIIPLSGNTSPVFSAQQFGGGSGGTQVIQLVVNRKVLAEAVAHANQDYKARK